HVVFRGDDPGAAQKAAGPRQVGRRALRVAVVVGTEAEPIVRVGKDRHVVLEDVRAVRRRPVGPGLQDAVEGVPHDGAKGRVAGSPSMSDAGVVMLEKPAQVLSRFPSKSRWRVALAPGRLLSCGRSLSGWSAGTMRSSRTETASSRAGSGRRRVAGRAKTLQN